MKKSLICFGVILVCVASRGFANVDCGEELISEILVYDGKVVVKHGSLYRGLGVTSSAQNQDKKFSLVLAAKATSTPVTLTYADGYDCSVNNYTDDPELVVLR